MLIVCKKSFKKKVQIHFLTLACLFINLNHSFTWNNGHDIPGVIRPILNLLLWNVMSLLNIRYIVMGIELKYNRIWCECTVNQQIFVTFLIGKIMQKYSSLIYSMYSTWVDSHIITSIKRVNRKKKLCEVGEIKNPRK